MDWLYWMLGITGGVVAIIVICLLAVRGRLMSLCYACEDAYTVVDRFLKKRYDLIPDLIDAMQEYAAHDADVIENLIDWRNKSIRSSSLMEKCEAESQLSDTLRTMFGLSEKYQELRVSASFTTLRHDMRAVEQDIANAGEQYNRCAQQYNGYYDQALTNLVAALLGKKKMAEFEIRQSVEG